MSRVGRVIIDYDLADEIKEELAEKVGEVEGLEVENAHEMRFDIMEADNQ